VEWRSRVVWVSYLRSCSVLQSTPEITVCGCLGRKLGWILYPSCKKRNIVELSHISVIMWWHTILLNITHFLQRQSSYRKYVAVMQHWYVRSDVKENGHFSPLEDAAHHSDTHARCTACSCVSGFLSAQYTYRCQLEVPLLFIVASRGQTNLHSSLSWHAETAHRFWCFADRASQYNLSN